LGIKPLPINVCGLVYCDVAPLLEERGLSVLSENLRYSSALVYVMVKRRVLDFPLFEERDAQKLLKLFLS